MSFWLMKSEPGTYSIDDLVGAKGQVGFWDGVRNYQARNFMRDKMQKDDLAFFYHSSCKVPGIVGIIRITKPGVVDETAFDPKSKYFDADSDPKKPRWYGVEFKLEEKFAHEITLHTLRTIPALKDMQLLQKGNRLSVTPVSDKEWEAIKKLHCNKG